MKSTWTTYDLSKFDIDKYFESYDYVEEITQSKYDKLSTKSGHFNKFYKNGKVHDFDVGEKVYDFALYCIKDKNSSNAQSSKHMYFILAEEVLSDTDLEELGKNCQCDYHLSYYPWPLSPCPCCVGCLQSEFPTQYVIKKTRTFVQNKKLKD